MNTTPQPPCRECGRRTFHKSTCSQRYLWYPVPQDRRPKGHRS